MTAMHSRIGRRRSTSSALRTGRDTGGHQNKKPGSKRPRPPHLYFVWEGGVFPGPPRLLVRAGCTPKRDLRHAPVADLGCPQLIRVATVKLVDRVEFLR